MPFTHQFKPTHKEIKKYHEDLAAYAQQDVAHEGATSTAFQNLLAATSKKAGWHLVPQLTTKIKGKQVRPDGTLRDEFNLHHGYWEAKDSSDKLDEEIRKKIKLGYPLSNTIFEDTTTAVLFQNGDETEPRYDLTKPQDVCDLLNRFYSHVEPDIVGFEQAIEDFKIRVPQIALALKEKIEHAHKTNKNFQTAFDTFFELCRQSLNPNLSVAAVDEMLIQHLLTIRLFDTIFDNPDFVRRNVIAAEVEKVIDALASKAFSREQFLKSLDRFYVAIESAAKVLGEDFTEKQHFLNTVYERFFQGYSVKVADTHGIVYTPQEIVDFMCASVEEVLKTEFGKTLGSKDVNILDPCTGTGNFIVNLIRRVPKKDLKRVYAEQLFANEVMLLPYYIAALNIEHAFFERSGVYESFEGLCFVDTLDLAEKKQQELGFMTEKNTERVQRQKSTPITVIVGNPPYNVGQLNENDNNKNRTYQVVEDRIRSTYTRDSAATNKNSLSDAYVKFFRWATDRLGDKVGVVCLVSNNGFLRGIAFDGFRRHLMRDFDAIYHFDFKGNARTSGERRRREGGNIFLDLIRVGVGISVLVRRGNRAAPASLAYHDVPDYWTAEQKKQYLTTFSSLSTVPWANLKADARFSWLVPDSADEFESLVPLTGAVESIFALSSLGVTTARDKFVTDFRREYLIRRVKEFADEYNAEVDRYKRAEAERLKRIEKKEIGPDDELINIDDFVRYERIKWSRDLKLDLRRGRYVEFNTAKVRRCAYRGFCKKFLYYDRILNEEIRSFARFLPRVGSEEENALICFSGPGHEVFRSNATHHIPEYKFANPSNGGTQCVPFYVYNEDGTNRRENITDWALEHFRSHYNDKKITKWDIFYYVYGILHHPGYRTKFADNLKRELPRIPLAPPLPAPTMNKNKKLPSPTVRRGKGAGSEGSSGFWAFSNAGKKLADLHLNYEQLEPWPLKEIEAEGVPLSYEVEKMRLSKDKTQLKVNESLTLAKIPPEVFDYRLGNRSALDWVIDQYQKSTDKRSGIESDPNNPDDEQYIVRLVGQVIRVSVETVKIVNALPREYSDRKEKA